MSDAGHRLGLTLALLTQPGPGAEEEKRQDQNRVMQNQPRGAVPEWVTAAVRPWPG